MFLPKVCWVSNKKNVLIMLDAQTSTKILKDIAGLIAKYPRLKSELQEIEDQVKPDAERH